MARVWAMSTYMDRMNAAIDAENWDEVERVRVATKTRLLEMLRSGNPQEDIDSVRAFLADCADRVRLSQRALMPTGPAAVAARILVDAETAGIAIGLAAYDPSETVTTQIV